jgi:hypothetical protein
MTARRENSSRSFFKELRLILKYAGQVWHLVPRKLKWALRAFGRNDENALNSGLIVHFFRPL